MINIKFYWNQSENNRLNKDIHQTYSYDGILKEDVSIINPSILIEQHIQNLAGANYMYIESLGRYYYITDMVSVNKPQSYLCY